MDGDPNDSNTDAGGDKARTDEAAADAAHQAELQAQGTGMDPTKVVGAMPASSPVDLTPPVITVAGPAVEGVDAWAGSMLKVIKNLPDDPQDVLRAWFTACLQDGFAQGVKADALVDRTDKLSAMLADADNHIADLEKQLAATKPEPKPETLFERVEDDAMRAAEEAAYGVSNLVADARGRKPDDGIDAWRKRTGGLWRHPHVG